jgi:hypothetical protein
VDKQDRITIELSRCNFTGGYQLSINPRRPDGSGHGYRIFGPKFLGDSILLRKTEISKRDATEIVGYLQGVLDGETR